jgi:hypothetical protein
MFVILFLFTTTSGFAAFTCGNLMVQEGTHGEEILSECGQPVSKERFFLEKYGDVDKWVYGPEAGYTYVIYLFLGKVVEVESIQQ